ncbi:hypothetical protein HK405_014274, partial [Cladochytrium tenue]
MVAPTATTVPSTDAVTGAASGESTAAVVVIGTRESELALVQTRHVQQLLQAAHPGARFDLLPMTTHGDRVLDVALSKIGEKSLFTRELEAALAAGRAHLVVHSLKDLPTTLPDGMALGAVLEREDPRDAVVVAQRLLPQNQQGAAAAAAAAPHPRLSELPAGSIIGTSS